MPTPPSRKQLAILAGSVLAALATGYGAGRYSAPTKVVERESTTSFATWDWRQSAEVKRVEAPVKRVTVRRSRPAAPAPAGCPPCPAIEETVTRETVGQVTTTTHADTRAAGAEAKEVVREKVVERDAPRLTLSATLAAPLSLAPTLVYGGLVQYRVAGPLVLGAGFDSSLRATVVAGVSW